MDPNAAKIAYFLMLFGGFAFNLGFGLMMLSIALKGQ